MNYVFLVELHTLSCLTNGIGLEMCTKKVPKRSRVSIGWL